MPDKEEANSYEEENKEHKIVIHLAGEVKNPGVFEVNSGSRINDLIHLAGGITENADITNVNLAYVLEDGMKIVIPNINEKTSIENKNDVMSSKNNTTSSQNNKININTATQSELEKLPGIGPSLAVKIIDFRNKNGKFKKIEQIKNVSGIGENKYNNIKSYICI